MNYLDYFIVGTVTGIPIAVLLWRVLFLTRKVNMSQVKSKYLRPPGIELRVALLGQTVILSDSQSLHYQAKYGSGDSGEWFEILNTIDGLSIEVRPIFLGWPERDPE